MTDSSTLGAPAHPLVFCDWLDVTFPSDSGLWLDLQDFLLGQCCSSKSLKEETTEYRHPFAQWGSFQLLRSSQGWSRISASGGSCKALKVSKGWGEYLSLIGSYPHTVTRVDTTMQIAVDAAPFVMGLVDRYIPGNPVKLTRKGVKPDCILKPILYGGKGLTGTFYAGRLDSGSSKASGRVYDKRNEQMDRHGVDIGPCLQIEMTGRKGLGVTLRDAYDPAPLFWHLASPAILPLPAGVMPWSPFTGELWSPGRIDPVDPYSRLASRVAQSVDLGVLSDLADACGDAGKFQLLRLIRSRLGLNHVSLSEVLA